MPEEGSEPQPQWRQPPEPHERPFAPYDPTPTFGGPRDNPAPEELQVRPVGPAQPTFGAQPGQRRLSRRGAVGLLAALVVGGAAYGTVRNGRQERDLTIPADTAQLSVSASSTDVRVHGTDQAPSASVTSDGSAVRAGTVSTNGSVTTVNVSSSADRAVVSVPAAVALSVETRSGDLTGDGLVSRQAVYQTSSGDVSLTYTQVPEQLSITTSSGDVRLRLPKGDYAYDVSSNSGDVSLPTGAGGSTQDQTRSGVVMVKIRTSSGDITVTVG